MTYVRVSEWEWQLDSLDCVKEIILHIAIWRQRA